MKHTKFLIFALLAAMTFSACGTDDTLQFYYPENGGTTGGGNTGGNTGGESTDKNNTNKNVYCQHATSGKKRYRWSGVPKAQE